MSEQRDEQQAQTPGQPDNTSPLNDQPTTEELVRDDWPNLEGSGESPADEAYATSAADKPSNEQIQSDLEADQMDQVAADEALQEGLVGPDESV